MRQKLPNFCITHSHTSYYYAHKLVSFAHTDRFLYIKLAIPITKGNTLFDVYRLSVLPLPVVSGNDSNALTEISGYAPYIAVSKDNLHYADMSEGDIQHCVGNRYKSCHGLIIPIEREMASCTSSLYYMDPTNIHKLCKHTLTHNSPSTYHKTIHVGQGRILISSLSQNWLILCPNKPPTKEENLPLSLIQLNCECSLHTNTFTLPAAASECLNMTSTSQSIPVNLDFLKSFYQDNYKLQLQSVQGVKLPDFSISQDKWDNVLAKDATFSYDLNVLAETFNNNETYFATKEDKLSYQLQSVMSSSLALPLFLDCYTLSL